MSIAAAQREAQREAKKLYALVSRPGALRSSQAPTKRPGTRRGVNSGNAGQGSKWIRREKRIAIYARDGYRCIWCQARVADARTLTAVGLHEDGTSARLATLDHFLARSSGGTNRADNLLTCCMQCKHDRQHMSALEWASKLAAQANGDSTNGWTANILERALQALDRPIVKAPKAE